MTTMKSNLHPSTEMLEKFVSGDLSVGVNLAISAHVEMCEHCKSAIQEIESRAAQHWAESATAEAIDYEADPSNLSLIHISEPTRPY
mgnify:CR=1 FL=1